MERITINTIGFAWLSIMDEFEMGFELNLPQKSYDYMDYLSDTINDQLPTEIENDRLYQLHFNIIDGNFIYNQLMEIYNISLIDDTNTIYVIQPTIYKYN